MKIERYLDSMGDDFTADLICEHCTHEQHLKDGQDDDFYYAQVLPTITCENCNKRRDGKTNANLYREKYL